MNVSFYDYYHQNHYIWLYLALKPKSLILLSKTACLESVNITIFLKSESSKITLCFYNRFKQVLSYLARQYSIVNENIYI